MALRKTLPRSRGGVVRRTATAIGGAPGLAWLLLPVAVVAATTVLPSRPQAAPNGPAGQGQGTTQDAATGHRHDTTLTPYSFVASLTPLAHNGWTATAGDSETGGHPTPAGHAIDGDPATFWHSAWSRRPAGSATHWLQVDLGATATVAGLRYVPRQDGNPNGRIGRFGIDVSRDGAEWTTVGTGTWADDATTKTAQFAATTARFVRLTALSEAGQRGPLASAAEVDVLEPASTTLGTLLDRTGWSATTSGVAASPAGAVLDGDVTTSWQARPAGSVATQPLRLRLDLGRTASVTGLVYLPRQDGVQHGRIERYTVEASPDGVTWTVTASGTWADDATQKVARFSPVTARFVRLSAPGDTIAVAELNLLDGSRPDLRLAAAVSAATLAAGTPGPIPHTGWVVTASDAEAGGASSPAANAIDGNSSTIWHSRWSGTPAPLPHWLRIDLGAARSVTGVRYLPRQDGSPNGRVGRYSVEVSSNGTTFTGVASGTWSDDGSAKTVTFPQTTTRYVRLYATSEAGNRGPWTSAAELDVLSPDAAVDPSKVGAWSGTTTFPLVPVAAAALPTNKLVLWSAYQTDNWGGSNGYTQTAIYDLTTGAVSRRTVTNTGHDMFCPGVAMLPDGRIMVTGGSNAEKTSIYDPRTDTWSAGPPLNIPRGYQSSTTLSTGGVFTVGGSWNGGAGGKTAEVWTPATGWRTLGGVPADPLYTADSRGAYRADNHTWLVAASGGRVFQAGPSRTMHWITTTGNGSITSAGTRADAPDMMNGSAVYYDVNKLLTVGGSPNYDDSDATRRAYTVDFSGTTPVTTRVGDQAVARAYANSVVLPDGKVLTIGGQPHAVPFTDTDAALAPELWNPATGTWTTMAPMAVPRTYHSVALLLPDARVFSGGGGLCGTCAVNHADGQIFTPPYLLTADGTARSRPAITAAPASVTPGASISVSTNRAVTAFSVVRMGTATHSVDTDQRRVPLRITATSGTTYTLAVPSDPGIVLPGTWMLFALDSSGTPSVAAVMNLGGGTTPTPAAQQIVGAGSGKCLDDANASTTPGSPAILWPCTRSANQLWTRTSGQELVTMGLCLDAKDGATAAGTPVQLWTCNGGGNQKWTARADGSLQGVASGLCLDVVNRSTADRAPTQLWPCNGGSNQRWTLT